jgi:hypothetical protein
MKTRQSELVAELAKKTAAAIQKTEAMKQLTEAELNCRPAPCRWSALECLEHLNLYGNYYLPEIERKLLLCSQIDGNFEYKSSFAGDFFTNTVKAGNQKKMKAPRNMTPVNAALTIATADTFLDQCRRLVAILEEAKRRDLMKVKTSVSLTKLMKLRIGDTIRFVVAHNERHILQAEAALAELKTADFV